MDRFTASSNFTHRSPSLTAVLLVQLGTPDDPEPAPVRRYLKQFLSDPRVVEIPRLAWWPLLNGIILNTRPRKSSLKYRAVWTPDGSPLQVHTRRQAALLQGLLKDKDLDVAVVYAMRYGNPSVAAGLRALRERNLTRLLIVPMYPQFAASTTASAFDSVASELATWRNLPELRMVRSFHDEPAYIAALASRVRHHWDGHGRGERLVMSFHGLPRRSLTLGDPYHCECLATARLLATELGLAQADWVATFQSRFGSAQWLEPYTLPTLLELARGGVASVDVVCPGFVADCLETLEEINIEARDAFREAGGSNFSYIPCLNDSPLWIGALAGLIERHLSGWPVAALPDDLRERQQADLLRREVLAKERGAAA